MYNSGLNESGNIGFGGYTTNNFYNNYNKTNLLHKKYHNMNQTEVPQMKFGNKQGSLNLNLIKNLDLNYIIKTNNILPLEKISQNLIYSDIKEEDYEDKNIPKLLKTFQYALEYLNEKQSKLEETNQKLDIEYNQLINQSYELEEKLKKNKIEISKNSKEKKEKEMLLVTYESIVNFNCNLPENLNIITKNINANFEEGTTTLDRATYQGELRGKFFCHICNGKYFNTESRLESHMKRRHLAQMKSNLKKEREEKKEEEMLEFDKKLEETKNYFQNIIQQKNEMFSKAKYEDEINMMKRENEEKMRNMMDYTKNFSEDMKNIFQSYMIQQEQNNKNIMNLANAASNKEKEKNEPQKIIIENPSENQINKLTNSIAQFGEILKQQNDKNNENLQKENEMLKNKLEILENKSKILDNNYNQIYRNINYERNINYYNNQNNNEIPNNNINLNNSPKNININPNNNAQNKNNNMIIEDDENDKIDNNKNIILNNPKQKFLTNNYDNPNPNPNQNKIINIEDNPYQEPNKNPQQINIQRERNPQNVNQDNNQENKKMINYILSSSLNESNINPQQINNNIEENNNKNLIKIKREESPNKNNNNFNKTAPSGFKKRIFKPIEQNNLLNSSTMKELDIFYANFMNRDQPLMEEEKPNPKEYLKELIPEDKKQDKDEISENANKLIEDKTKKEHYLLIDDLKNKDKKELLDIIDKTMQNINEVNANNKILQLYYETTQKAIDLKLYEEEAKMMKNAYDNKGELKRSRSSSKAKIVIQQAEKEIFDNQ